MSQENMDHEAPYGSSARAELLPENPTFAGHQTFALRSGWLKKGLDALQTETVGTADVFRRDDALVTLGVGKNMVQAIRHWLVVTRLVEDVPGTRGQQLTPSWLGLSLMGRPDAPGWDPYLEDEATLWLLHWRLAGPGSLALTWVWTFSYFNEYEFSRQSLADAVYRAATARCRRTPALSTIERDVECLLHTYAGIAGSRMSEDHLDSPLVALGLIRHAFERSYRFDIGHRASLPTTIFAAMLLEYWEWAHPAHSTMSFHDIAYGEGSPGRVLKLDEDTLLEYLDHIADVTDGMIRFDDTPLGRQLIRTKSETLDAAALLSRYYGA
ncbi:MAG: DUF4007 family protein [Chthonomonadales bacterium]|nr:DUF4007 family protein [Chthonomonadales bacterium]